MRPNLYQNLVLLLISVMLSFAAQAQVLGEVLYSWDFANGLPTGWTNTSASSIGLWEYRGPTTSPNVSVGPRGACAGATGPINSVTPSNGFMIFDSNYWDNTEAIVGSCASGLGTGLDPAPHTAWLTTQNLDFSGVSNVSITFQQQFRIYTGTTKVQASTNNGASWFDVGTNVGTSTPNAVWVTFNISSSVGGLSNVKLRFEFSGFYYWWQIDDITIYSPNDNDVMLTEPGYTVNPTPTNIYNELEYDQYPIVMIPPIKFRGKATNIGGQTQTNVSLNAKVLNASNAVIHTQTSTAQNMTPGQIISFTSPNSYTPAATLGDYRVALQLNQSETDENAVNNLDTLDYTISQYTFARDEGPMEDVFEPAPVYLTEPYEIGNVFEGANFNRKCHSVAVGIGQGTEVGSQIQAIVYNEYYDEVRSVSDPYTVNLADLNEEGEEFTVVLPLNTVLTMYPDTMYIVMVKNLDGNAPFRVARSGDAPQSTSFVNYYNFNALYYLAKMPLVRMNIFLAGQIPGCMDPTAMNYNPSATVSDGSCRYPGCTIEEAINYDPTANWDDGSCIVPGCMDPEALNYNALATEENGSCEYGGCTNPDAINYDPTATNDDGSCIVPGCTNPLADNYNPDATEDDGSCFISGCMDPVAANFEPNATVDDGTCLYGGCTNPIAINYDPNADIDDGTCLIEGCTDPTAANFNPEANVSTDTCEYPGCTDSEAANYNENANVDDGSCLYFGCTDPDADNYDPNADLNDGSCFYLGCTDPAADNFDPSATIDDGSCLFLGCTDPAAANFDPLAQDDDGSCQYPGCTDPAAVNYDANANLEDGTCEYFSAFFSLNTMTGCTPLTLNVNNQSTVNPDATCTFYLNEQVIHVGCEDFVYTITSPGTYSMTYQMDLGTATDTYTINNIVAIPPPPAPTITFNEGTQLMETSANASAYSWSVDGTLISNSNATTISPLINGIYDNGNYMLTITDNLGCQSSSVPFFLLYPSYTIDVTEPCAPATVEIMNNTDLPVGAYCTITLGNGTPLQVLQPGLNTFNYNQAGEYQIEITANSNTVSNSVADLIETSDGVIPILFWNQASNLVQCNNCSANGTASWIINGEQQTGQGPFSDELGEIYQVFLTTPLGCTGSSAIIINSVLEEFLAQIELYPNPANETQYLISPLPIEHLTILDLTGKEVAKLSPNTTRVEINTSALSQGTYFIQLEIEGHITYLRSIIQR
ncbi:MAG: T9SS type A sorting domain-containing protein [Flavobacteriales bacterium]